MHGLRSASHRRGALRRQCDCGTALRVPGRGLWLRRRHRKENSASKPAFVLRRDAFQGGYTPWPPSTCACAARTPSRPGCVPAAACPPTRMRMGAEEGVVTDMASSPTWQRQTHASPACETATTRKCPPASPLDAQLICTGQLSGSARRSIAGADPLACRPLLFALSAPSGTRQMATDRSPVAIDKQKRPSGVNEQPHGVAPPPAVWPASVITLRRVAASNSATPPPCEPSSTRVPSVRGGTTSEPVAVVAGECKPKRARARGWHQYVRGV
jgi:hypothetical protein